MMPVCSEQSYQRFLASAVYGHDCELTCYQTTQHDREQPPLNGGLGDEFAEGGNQL